MNTTIHILTGSKKIIPYKQIVTASAKYALARTSTCIPFRGVDIVIRDNQYSAIPETGVGGKTIDAHTILIAVNLAFANLHDALTFGLKRCVVHELHHVARWQTVGYGTTLLEAIISEGLATHFEEDVVPGPQALWANVINSRNFNKFLSRAKKEFSATSYNHPQWFFGKGDPTIPRWAGYSIGYKLVTKYIAKHPGETAASLYNKPAKEFI